MFHHVGPAHSPLPLLFPFLCFINFCFVFSDPGYIPVVGVSLLPDTVHPNLAVYCGSLRFSLSTLPLPLSQSIPSKCLFLPQSSLRWYSYGPYNLVSWYVACELPRNKYNCQEKKNFALLYHRQGEKIFKAARFLLCRDTYRVHVCNTFLFPRTGAV